MKIEPWDTEEDSFKLETTINENLQHFPTKKLDFEEHCEKIAVLIFNFEQLNLYNEKNLEKAKKLSQTFEKLVLENIKKVLDTEDENSEEIQDEGTKIVKRLATQIRKGDENLDLLESSSKHLNSVFVTSKSLSTEIDETHKNIQKEKSSEKKENMKTLISLIIFFLVCVLVLGWKLFK